MRTVRIALAGVAVAALALTACSGGASPTPEESGAASPTGSPSDTATDAPAVSTTVADTIYGPIEIPAPEDGELTVVALGWSDAEVALALGVQPVGVSDWLGFGADNKGVGPWAVDKFGEVTPAVYESPFQGYDYEAIASLDPDVILNTRSGADEDVFNRLSEIAPTVYAPEGTADFGTAWDVQVNQVAQALGLEDEGQAVIESVSAVIDEQAAAHPEFQGVTAVTGTKFGDQYGAYIAGDFRWDLMESLGFVQNPPVLDLEPSGFYVALSAEQISALDAEVAVFFPIGYTLDEMLADPLLSSLNVVKNERVVWLEATDDLTQAFSAASPLSIPVAAEGVAGRLAEILG
ncbi:MAG TPA: iron-siderophore ABC transporter substrate-binding protein [Arachnia sp.]|nr:iron-siderophore ABC transporter substrate-binding protein [Arachnia sp.]HMT87443.1 iron-siderophore ABC transporter substrate-binding protein [Arachnia sp.]